MTTSTENPTGVRSFNAEAYADWSTFHAIGSTLDAFVHQCRREDRLISQADFLDLVRDIAASISYADCCTGCSEVRHPHRVERDGQWLTCSYACLPCRRAWKCGYALEAARLFGE